MASSSTLLHKSSASGSGYGNGIAPISFQIIDIRGKDQAIESPEDDFDDDSNDSDTEKHTPVKKEYIIEIYGVNKAGDSVGVKVSGFTPHFYVRFPNYWSDRHFDTLMNAVHGKVPEYTKKNFHSYKIMKRKVFWGFRFDENAKGEKLYNCARVSFKTMSGLYNYLGEFQKDIDVYGVPVKTQNPDGSVSIKNGKIRRKFKIYESNINPLIRFLHFRNINPSGWITVNKYNRSHDFRTKIGIECQWNAIDSEPDNNSIAPYKEASFDIEVNSSHGDFPVAQKSYSIFLNQLLSYLALVWKNEKRILSESEIALLLHNSLSGIPHDEIFTTITHKTYNKPIEFIQMRVQKVYPQLMKLLELKIFKLLDESDIPKFYKLSNSESFSMIQPAEIKKQEAKLRRIHAGAKTSTKFDTELRKWTKDLEETKCTEAVLGLWNRELPQINGDEIIQIGTTIRRSDQKDFYYKSLICLGECDPIEGVETISCKTEKDVLIEWQKMILKHDPDILIGYNIFGFDMKYMKERAEELGCLNDLVQLGRKKEDSTKYVVKKLSSSGLGDNLLEFFDIEGRVVVDIMKCVQKDHKLEQYKLDSVSSNFMRGTVKAIHNNTAENTCAITTDSVDGLKENDYITFMVNNGIYEDKYDNGGKFKILSIAPYSPTDTNKFLVTIAGMIDLDLSKLYKVHWCETKDDVSPKDMFRLYRKGAAERSIIGKYCIQDCVLVSRITNKLQIIMNNMGMSNVCSVPLSFLFMRGQGVKLFSLVSKFCRENDYIIPVIKKEDKKGNGGGDDDEVEEDDPEDSFQGAFVLEPQTGIYYDDEPVAVNDFNSLYPSCMMSHNLCFSSIALKDKYIGEKGAEYLKKIGFDFLDVKFDVFQGEGDKKEKIGEKTCRYIQFKNPDGSERKGMIPNILSKLLKARKDTRKLQEKTKDAFQWSVLEGLQLAYKVTANSLYGQVGASTSPICMKDIAASTTAVGRQNLMFAKDYVEANYPGAVAIYGDTDSIFIKFKMPPGVRGMDAIKKSMELSIDAGQKVSALLPRPHNWDFEKVISPFILLSKKRYVGQYYTDDSGKSSIKSMGIVLKRRDNAPIVKVVYGGVIEILMKEKNIDKAVTFVQDTCRQIVDGKFPMEKFIVSKTLSANYKNPDAISHKALANRMGERNPGNKPQVNDRIPFLYIKTDAIKGKKLLQSDKIEHPDYIREKSIPVDYMFYVTNQIMNPVTQIFECVYKDKAEQIVFGDLLRTEKNKKEKIMEITSFFKPAAKKTTASTTLAIESAPSAGPSESSGSSNEFSSNIIDDTSSVKTIVDTIVKKTKAPAKSKAAASVKEPTEPIQSTVPTTEIPSAVPSSVPSSDGGCKHKCANKAACKHACCKKGL